MYVCIYNIYIYIYTCIHTYIKVSYTTHTHTHTHTYTHTGDVTPPIPNARDEAGTLYLHFTPNATPPLPSSIAANANTVWGGSRSVVVVGRGGQTQRGLSPSVLAAAQCDVQRQEHAGGGTKVQILTHLLVQMHKY